MTQHADSVRIVLFADDKPGEFLIVSEADDPKNHKLPGGKLEPGETPDQAATRELREEVGLSAKAVSLKLAGKLDNQHSPHKRHIFVGHTASSAIVPSSEIERTAWVDEKSIPPGENRDHILTALQLGRSALENSS